jgi:hypothetical protein
MDDRRQGLHTHSPPSIWGPPIPVEGRRRPAANDRRAHAQVEKGWGGSGLGGAEDEKHERRAHFPFTRCVGCSRGPLPRLLLCKRLRTPRPCCGDAARQRAGLVAQWRQTTPPAVHPSVAIPPHSLSLPRVSPPPSSPTLPPAPRRSLSAGKPHLQENARRPAAVQALRRDRPRRAHQGGPRRRQARDRDRRRRPQPGASTGGGIVSRSGRTRARRTARRRGCARRARGERSTGQATHARRVGDPQQFSTGRCAQPCARSRGLPPAAPRAFGRGWILPGAAAGGDARGGPQGARDPGSNTSSPFPLPPFPPRPLPPLCRHSSMAPPTSPASAGR